MSLQTFLAPPQTETPHTENFLVYRSHHHAPFSRLLASHAERSHTPEASLGLPLTTTPPQGDLGAPSSVEQKRRGSPARLSTGECPHLTPPPAVKWGGLPLPPPLPNSGLGRSPSTGSRCRLRKSVKSVFKLGAPGWLSRLNIRLLLGSRPGVRGLETRVELSAVSVEPAWDPLSPLSLSAPPRRLLSVSRINKH